MSNFLEGSGGGSVLKAGVGRRSKEALRAMMNDIEIEIILWGEKENN